MDEIKINNFIMKYIINKKVRFLHYIINTISVIGITVYSFSTFKGLLENNILNTFLSIIILTMFFISFEVTSIILYHLNFYGDRIDQIK